MRTALLALSLVCAAPALSLAAPAAKPAPAAEAPEAVPFIHDDYPRALAEAKAKKLPLFVDIWAPWCHTCRFMSAYVFTDRALEKQADRFVWLSIDSEKEQNAAFVAKYPIDAWPTLLVVDPQKEAVVLKWLGSASVADLGGLLDDGARALTPAHADKASQLLSQADAVQAQGKPAEAAALYRQALQAGGAGWSEAPRVVQSLTTVLQLSGDAEGCARVAREHAPTLPRNGFFANVVAAGLDCAANAPAEAPWRNDALAALEPLTLKAVALPGLLADDRSGIYETLVGLAETRHDAAAQKKLAGQWLSFLEAEAAKAPDAARRSAFDPHRVEAAIALGEPARVLPALKASERDLPDDYNAFAREADVLQAMGKLPEALAANDEALKRVYGPRTLRVLRSRASILTALHRDAEARQVLQQALSKARSLPAGQVSPRTIQTLEAQLSTKTGAAN